MKTTKKFIEEFEAEDITNLSFWEVQELYNTIDKNDIAFSSGKYGTNAYLFQDKKTGKFYKITARNTTLFQFL